MHRRLLPLNRYRLPRLLYIDQELQGHRRPPKGRRGSGRKGDTMTLLHRVVFYGDHPQSARHPGDLMNIRIVEAG